MRNAQACSPCADFRPRTRWSPLALGALEAEARRHRLLSMDQENRDFRLMTADIVAAYVASRNHVTAGELPNLIASVHTTLLGLGTPLVQEVVKAEPAVSLRKAVQPDAITCLHCGKRFKSIRRHLENAHGETPEQYRAVWGLPKDSPMVAPAYAESRSLMAKAMGFGQRGREAATEVLQGVVEAARDALPPGDETPGVAPPKRRGRPPKGT